MKKFLIMIFLLGLVACEENVDGSKNLTQVERDYLNSLASQKCTTDSNKSVAAFKEASNKNLNAFLRREYWKVAYKNGTATSGDTISVWKKTSTAIYYLYQVTSNSVTSNKFIKSTNTFNDEMISNLQLQKCLVKPIPITLTSTSISMTFLDVLEKGPSTYFLKDTTYSGNTNWPMFFSSINRTIKSDQIKSETDRTVTKTENSSYTITYVNNDADLDDLYTDYTNSERCVYNYNNTTPKSFTLPYQLVCVPMSGGEPNPFPAGDASLNFPASELSLL